MYHCSHLISVAVINIDQIQLGEKRVYFALRIIQHITEGRPGRNSNKITGCNHGGMQLTSLLPGHIQLLFLQSPSPLTCLISLTVTWILLQQLTIKKCPTCLPTSQSDKGNSSAEASSSQACQVDNQGWPSQSFISLCLSLHINILPPSINFLYIWTHTPPVVPAFCSMCYICNIWWRSILIPPKAFTYLFSFFIWRYFHTIYS